MRQNLIELQGKIDDSTITLGDFMTLPSAMDRSSRQKFGTDIVELNRTINQLDMIDTYRLLHPTTAENTFFSSSHSPG